MSAAEALIKSSFACFPTGRSSAARTLDGQGLALLDGYVPHLFAAPFQQTVRVRQQGAELKAEFHVNTVHDILFFVFFVSLCEM